MQNGHKKSSAIPVNAMANASGTGIAIERISIDDLNAFEESHSSHRHDGHSFFLLERGTVHLEIDFQNYTLHAPSVIYIHPDQVHRSLAPGQITVSSLVMTNEFVQPEYLELLEEIAPAKPLVLDQALFKLLSGMVDTGLKLSEQHYPQALKDSCNALIAVLISQYAVSTSQPNRFEAVTRSFRKLLEQDYSRDKRPASYAGKLHLSIAYLNECVKQTTGYPVSHHIQQRVILEAKRLLYHTDHSVKEIAATLGYDDYPYFSRLFKKLVGISALTFRNRD
jgi:AraC family transcriptional regulator, transcriptional activator of pobA